jgi:hypothetical protein
MFYRKWAYEHEKYIGHQNLLFQDYPILKLVHALQIKDNIYFGTANLPVTMARYGQMDAINLQRRLMLDLYTKNINQFMADLRVLQPYYHKMGKMPECMQEILVLYALNAGDTTANYFPIERDVAERVKSFISAVQPYANDLDVGAEALKDYQGSYCYFFVFGNVFPNKNNVKK